MMERRAILSRDIQEFGWSARVSHIFIQEGLRTMRDLCEYTQNEIMRYPNFGKVSLAEVKRVLAEHGLQLSTARYEMRADGRYDRVMNHNPCLEGEGAAMTDTEVAILERIAVALERLCAPFNEGGDSETGGALAHLTLAATQVGQAVSNAPNLMINLAAIGGHMRETNTHLARLEKHFDLIVETALKIERLMRTGQ